jgi:hypothetical protein
MNRLAAKIIALFGRRELNLTRNPIAAILPAIVKAW